MIGEGKRRRREEGEKKEERQRSNWRVAGTNGVNEK
jgi:hypothetical protein